MYLTDFRLLEEYGYLINYKAMKQADLGDVNPPFISSLQDVDTSPLYRLSMIPMDGVTYVYPWKENPQALNTFPG